MERQGALPKILETGRNEFELVEFWIKEKMPDGSIYTHIFGLNVAKVREVIWLPEVIKVPNLPRGIEGVINVRGDVLPVVDLSKAMGINEPPPEELNSRKAVIVTQFYGIEVGLIVHEAKRIRRFTWDKLKSVPSAFSMKFGSKVIGVIEIEDGKFLLVLDIESLFVEMGLVSVKEETEVQVEEDVVGPVMVVDDSFAARKIICDILEKAGFKDLIVCKDGLEAWETINRIYNNCVENRIDILDKVSLVITDLEMPNMDGYTLTKKIKDHPALKKIPVIINTSLSGEFNALRAKTVNADAFLVKFHPDELIVLVKRLIKKARGERGLKVEESSDESDEVSHQVGFNSEHRYEETILEEPLREVGEDEKGVGDGEEISLESSDIANPKVEVDRMEEKRENNFDDILSEILKEVESGKMGSQTEDTATPIYEVPTESVLKRSYGDLLELLSKLKGMVREVSPDDVGKSVVLQSLIDEIEKEIKRREKKDDGKVIEKLYKVTKESEEHGTKLMSKLEGLLDLVLECQGLVEEAKSDPSKLDVLSVKLSLMNDLVFETMSDMQYQDVLRQKIERVIVALKRLNDYLNEWFGTDFIGE